MSCLRRFDLRRVNVLISASNFFDMVSVFFSVAEIDEILVPAVDAFYALRMLDGTPVLFGSCDDLSEVGQDAVAVSAVFTVQFLDEIQVS